MNPPQYWFLILSLLFSGGARKQPNASVYNEKANAQHDIAAAIANAEESKRNVVLIFGANWCSDCLALDAQMHKPELASIIEETLSLSRSIWGVGIRTWIWPSSITYPSSTESPPWRYELAREALYAMDQGQFADASNMSYKSIKAFFVRWMPRH